MNMPQGKLIGVHVLLVRVSMLCCILFRRNTQLFVEYFALDLLMDDEGGRFKGETRKPLGKDAGEKTIAWLDKLKNRNGSLLTSTILLNMQRVMQNNACCLLHAKYSGGKFLIC